MVRCLALLLGLSLVAFAGGRPAIAQSTDDAIKQAPAAEPAQDQMPAAAADKPDTKPKTPAAADSAPAAQVDTTTPAPVVATPPPSDSAPVAATPPADTPADAVVTPVVDVPALPTAKPVLVETALPRDRNWGHPDLVRFLERLAPLAAKATGWPGILVGDMGQPRGGPTAYGHKSHQTGLDVDIWFRPMPDHRLSKEEREKLPAFNLVADDWKDVNPKTWTPAYAQLIRTAAEQPEVERVLVNAAIKKELCRLEGKQTWRWMAKVRPWYAHQDHIHVRLKCPADSPHCKSQPAVPGGDGCEKSELAFWFSDKVLHPKPKTPGGKRKEILLADLPAACKTVLHAPAKVESLAAGEK
jgi:penicillin-insensitive murein endopeptidase